MGAFVSFFFSGFILGKVPFPLSPSFRIMLQVSLPSLLFSSLLPSRTSTSSDLYTLFNIWYLQLMPLANAWGSKFRSYGMDISDSMQIFAISSKTLSISSQIISSLARINCSSLMYATAVLYITLHLALWGIRMQQCACPSLCLLLAALPCREE